MEEAREEEGTKEGEGLRSPPTLRELVIAFMSRSSLYLADGEEEPRTRGCLCSPQ